MSGSPSKDWKRDWKRDNHTDANPVHMVKGLLDRGPNTSFGANGDAIYPSIYLTGFPSQWGQMSGPMMPLQNVNGWQLNPMQIDAMLAAGNGQGGQQGLPAAGSFLARLAALQQGGRNGS